MKKYNLTPVHEKIRDTFLHLIVKSEVYNRVNGSFFWPIVLHVNQPTTYLQLCVVDNDGALIRNELYEKISGELSDQLHSLVAVPIEQALENKIKNIVTNRC
jgi:hypothetical protein